MEHIFSKNDPVKQHFTGVKQNRATMWPSVLKNAMLIISLVLFLPTLSQAQDCDLACIGTLESPLQTVLNDTCGINITTEMVVRDINACPGSKLLTVRDSFNNFIAEGVDFAPFSGAPFIDMTLSVTIMDQLTGTVCVAFINVVDNSEPVITSCPNVTVNCLESIEPDDIGYPVVEDNCAAVLNYDYMDSFTARDCLTDTAGIVAREWMISDTFGTAVSCIQQISILRASSMDVNFPADVNLDCDEPDADPSITGMPHINGFAPMHGDLCGLSVGMEDDTIFICNTYMYRIERTWTVVEECTNFFDERMQVILVSDNEGPELTCPNSSALSYTSAPGDCGAIIALPTVTATDNCSSIITYSVTTSYGATDFNPISGVPPGMHTVQYQAVDECGNLSTCLAQITVTDDVAPVAACDDELLVSIPSSGYALLAPSAFDEGSSDNCANPIFLKAKRNDAASCDLANGDDSSQAGYQEWYDDLVVFCCEDVPTNPVIVTLRVYEVDPGNGPVDPSREAPNGDLFGHYTECQSIVTLQDGSGPVFTSCPPSFTIQCSDEQDDLSVYGSPTATDNCGFTIDSTSSITVNDCGVGEIIRSWTVTDLYGNTAQCSQTIAIQNNEALNESHIDWPEDYTFHECGASTDVENLPVDFQEPIVNWDGCGSLAINHSDLLFNIVPGACYKVLRTWTVIDWCRFNTENLTGNEGRFTHVQEIKVIDNIDPEISCPPPVEVNVGDDCQTAFVNLQLPTAEDCSSNISFSNNSPYANNNGINASGNYPVGTTTVRFYANDNCNNNAACTTTVTVSDIEAPNISCIVGFTSTLMPTSDGGGMSTIDAASFIASSGDNCTQTEFLKYTINRPEDGTAEVPIATEIMFDCLDAGSIVEVQVWATDLEGNHNYCVTEVNVQDSGNNCNGEAAEGGMIAGGVVTEDGQDVESIMVNIEGEAPDMRYTGIDGAFSFEDLSLGMDYTVVAESNEDILNGITTFDLILIGKHILGTSLLDSPYKIIAADIDRSGHVSTLDIIKLRKLILHVAEELPNENTSWRFVDASYVFPDPSNPFLTYFPEAYNVNELNGAEMHADFIAIKVGDVNGSAIANRFSGGVDNRSNSLPLVIEIPNESVKEGEDVDIIFQADYMNEWMGYQFTLQFDPTLIQVDEIVAGDLPNVYEEENFHFVSQESGLITVIWNEFGESAHNGKSTLFSLKGRAKADGEIKDLVYLSSRLTKAEGYTQDGVVSPINLNFIDAEAIVNSASSFELFQNRPNPWNNETIIPFQLDPGGEASLSVYDMAGKLVYKVVNNYSEGYHEINIRRDDLPAIGLFYYTLESGDQKATRKMVLMD